MAGRDGFKDGYKCVLIAWLLWCIRIRFSPPMNFPGQIQLRARAVVVAWAGGSVPVEKSSQVGAGVGIGGAARGTHRCVRGCTVPGAAALCLCGPPSPGSGIAVCRAFSGGIWFLSRSPPAKAGLIYFQATQKGCFGVGSAGKKRLNWRCRDVFPHGEWWGNTEHVLNRREVITLLIFLCDLIKM